MIIDPHRFVGKQLTPKATAENDYSVTVDGLVAGRIMLRPAAFCLMSGKGLESSPHHIPGDQVQGARPVGIRQLGIRAVETGIPCEV